MGQSKNKKIICPKCNGNGYIKLPTTALQPKEQIAQCVVCDSQGEIDEDKANSIYIDSDGIHRMH